MGKRNMSLQEISYIAPGFDQRIAFSRNRGLISQEEQSTLMNKRVAIPGCGGVGGLFAETLARIGIGKFRIADDDVFEIGNFNRQAGATVSTVNMNKADVTATQIRDINPLAEVEVWHQKVTEKNALQFISGADVVLDGIDFYALPDRRALFQACWQQQVPAMTSAPLGFSATLHIFAPGGMSFDEYFDLHKPDSLPEQLLKFLIGLAPRALNRMYTDYSSIDPERKTGPSSILGTQQAASLVCAEVLRILLGWGQSALAPNYLQFDNYRQCLAKSRMPFGNRHIRQRLAYYLAKRLLKKQGVWQKLQTMAAQGV